MEIVDYWRLRLVEATTSPASSSESRALRLELALRAREGEGLGRIRPSFWGCSLYHPEGVYT